MASSRGGRHTGWRSTGSTGAESLAEEAQKIGWTKLSLIAVYVTHQSADEMLNHAEEKTVPQLRAFLDHAELPTRVLAFNLTDEQYATVASALLSNGAYLTGTAGLGNKKRHCTGSVGV